MANLHKKSLDDENRKSMSGMGEWNRNNNNNERLSHKNATPHKFANNENGKKNAHTQRHRRSPSLGRVANKVPNHEAYKMKIHPQKKLPRIFPLFFAFLFMGEGKKETRKKHCVCARVCVWVVAWLLVSLSLCLQNNQKRTSRRRRCRRQSHLPLATWLCSIGGAWSTWPAPAATLPVVDVVGDIKCC